MLVKSRRCTASSTYLRSSVNLVPAPVWTHFLLELAPAFCAKIGARAKCLAHTVASPQTSFWVKKKPYMTSDGVLFRSKHLFYSLPWIQYVVTYFSFSSVFDVYSFLLSHYPSRYYILCVTLILAHCIKFFSLSFAFIHFQIALMPNATSCNAYYVVVRSTLFLQACRSSY